jgi:hypothetical protein
MNPTGIEPPYNPAITGPDFKLSEGRYNAAFFFTDYLCIWPGAVISDIEICANPMTATWLRADIQKPELWRKKKLLGGDGSAWLSPRLSTHPYRPQMLNCP